MNKNENILLVNLNSLNGIIGRDIVYTSSEIIYLSMEALIVKDSWREKSQKQDSLKNEKGDWLDSYVKTLREAERLSMYLNASGYVTCKKEGDIFRIAMTANGIDMVRELSTYRGRMDIFFKKHKEGVILTLTVILVVPLIIAVLSGIFKGK